jgi:hypothetical protein
MRDELLILAFQLPTLSEVRGVQHGCGQKRLDFSLLSYISGSDEGRLLIPVFSLPIS